MGDYIGFRVGGLESKLLKGVFWGIIQGLGLRVLSLNSFKWLYGGLYRV